MFVKKLLRKILFNFFRLIIRISISRLNKKKYKNYIVSCPLVNTYGDPVHHVDHIRLLNFESKKRHLIICPDISPSNVYLRFFLPIKLYRFYSEKVFLYCGYILNCVRKITDLYHFYNFFLLSQINKKIANFNYYKAYYKQNDKIYLNNKKYFSKEFVSAYCDIRSYNNKFENLKKRNILKKKHGHLILNDCPGFDKNDFNYLKNQLGIKRDYVCLHIRNTYNDNDPRSIKDLDSYFPIIDYLKNKYDIVILGTNSDNNFTDQFLSSGVLNYKFSKYQSVKNDILLIGNCKIYLGNFSGPQAIAYTFGKPMILFDGWPIYSIYYNYSNLRIYPKIIYKNNRLVKLNEILNSENYFREHLKNSWRLETSSPEDKLKELKLFLKDFDSKRKFPILTSKHEIFKNLLNPMHLGPYYSYNVFSKTYLDKVI